MWNTRSHVRRLLSLLPLLFGLGFMACLLPIRAQETADPANPNLTAHLFNCPFARALDILCKSTNVSCSLPDEVAALINPDQEVTIDISNGTFQQALNSLLDQVDPGLAFRLENGAYIVEATGKPHVAKVVKPKPTRHGLTFHAKDTPFEDAVYNLFRGATTSYRIAPSVTAFLDPVTYEATDVTFEEALTQLLKAVPGQKTPLTFRREKGVYVITSGNDADKSGDKANAVPIGLPSYHPEPAIKELSVLNTHPDVPLRLLFKQPGVSYALMLPTGVAATPRLTFAMRGVPLEQAVVHLLRSAPAEPMLFLQLQNLSDEPSEKQATEPSNGQVKAQPSRLYLVKPRSPKPLPESDDPTLSEFHHSFRFQNVSLYDALKALLTGTITNYSLDPKLRQYKVSVEGDDLTLDKAIAKLLAASPKSVETKTTNGILSVLVR